MCDEKVVVCYHGADYAIVADGLCSPAFRRMAISQGWTDPLTRLPASDQVTRALATSVRRGADA